MGGLGADAGGDAAGSAAGSEGPAAIAIWGRHVHDLVVGGLPLWCVDVAQAAQTRNACPWLE